MIEKVLRAQLDGGHVHRDEPLVERLPLSTARIDARLIRPAFIETLPGSTS